MDADRLNMLWAPIPRLVAAVEESREQYGVESRDFYNALQNLMDACDPLDREVNPDQ